jgi:hypothetical protein
MGDSINSAVTDKLERLVESPGLITIFIHLTVGNSFAFRVAGKLEQAAHASQTGKKVTRRRQADTRVGDVRRGKYVVETRDIASSGTSI